MMWTPITTERLNRLTWALKRRVRERVAQMQRNSIGMHTAHSNADTDTDTDTGGDADTDTGHHGGLH